MQKILGYMRKAIQEFDLIQNGDKIAVGVSGGKDSLVLLEGLVRLKRFIGIDYEVTAITLDPRFPMNHKKLRHWVGDTMTYSIVLSSFAALACAYVFFIYAIDIGTRAVKLGVLQLISPVPVVLRIFPNTKKSFDTWFSHLKKTYLELFIRVAVIFFALEVVKMKIGRAHV